MMYTLKTDSLFIRRDKTIIWQYLHIYRDYRDSL